MCEYKQANFDFKNFVAGLPGAERVLNCYLCGTCTAGCPISAIDSQYNPRKIMRQILLGFKDDVINSKNLWKCYQCHTCVAHCPQDVRFADIVRALRELAIKEGVVPNKLAEKIEEADLQFRRDRLEKINQLFSATDGYRGELL